MVPPVARWRIPTVGFAIVRFETASVGPLPSTTRPYQAPGDDAAPANCTGCAAVPLTVSVPRTVSSVRVASWPEAWRSPDANCTTVPAWIVRNAPAGTVMSPCTMYGLPAGVHVSLTTLP